MRLSTSAIALSICLASPALAQPKALGVYDRNNNFIGTFESTTYIAREYSGTWYLLVFGKTHGLQPDALFLFPTGDCSGQKYIHIDDQEPPIAMFDGSTLWAPSGQEANVASLNSFSWGGFCYPSSGYGATLELPKVIDASPNRFVAPFTVR